MICADTLIDSEVVKLPCNPLHMFHTKCIETWLISKPLCPCCRANVCHWGKPREVGAVYVVTQQPDVRRGSAAEDYDEEDSYDSNYSSEPYGSDLSYNEEEPVDLVPVERLQ